MSCQGKMLVIFYLMWIQSCKMLKTNNNNSACQIKWWSTTYLQTPSWKSGLIFYDATSSFDRHLSGKKPLVLLPMKQISAGDIDWDTEQLPKRNAPSSGAGCCEGHWHGLAKSSFGRVGSCGTAGTGTGNPSCSRSGNRSTPQGGRLEGGEERARERKRSHCHLEKKASAVEDQNKSQGGDTTRTEELQLSSI